MGRFTIPRDVYFGSGVIEQLKEITGTRALVCVGSERLIESGVTAKVQALLQEAGIESMLYHGHEPDPTFGMAHRCAVKMMEYQPDVISRLAAVLRWMRPKPLGHSMSIRS